MNIFPNKVPLAFLMHIRPLSWKGISFGFENGWLEIESLKTCAERIINEDFNQQEIILDLSNALAVQDISEIEQCLKVLSQNDLTDEKLVFNQWGYILIKFIYDHFDNFDNPFDAITYVYESVDYPEEMEGFIPYMPAERNFGISEYPESKNDFLKINLKHYIESNKKFFEG